MAGTDPIYTTTEPMSDALVAAVTAQIGLTLGDRTGGGILADPVIGGGFIGKNQFLGALAANAVFVAWGADKFLAVAEGTDFAIVDLASDKITVTPARMGFARQVSDMARSLDAWGITDWVNFARESSWAWSQTVVETLAALFTSFSTTGGNSGGDATWGQMVADFMTLGTLYGAPPYVAIIRPKDWGNIAQDAFSLGGYVANDAETGGYKAASNPGFKGAFMGGQLRIYTTAECPTSGADDVCGMFGGTALRWNAHMPTPSPATRPILWTPAFGVEMGREALKSDDVIAASTHLGASLGQDYAGLQMPFLT